VQLIFKPPKFPKTLRAIHDIRNDASDAGSLTKRQEVGEISFCRLSLDPRVRGFVRHLSADPSRNLPRDRFCSRLPRS
jgi:hypothetical protein